LKLLQEIEELLEVAGRRCHAISVARASMSPFLFNTS
jgi:hypothetical protein